MTIDIHFYSISKDLAGQAVRPLVLPERATLSDALEALFRELPALAPLRESCLYAVGTQYAAMDTALAPGDVVSIVPPMQGG